MWRWTTPQQRFNDCPAEKTNFSSAPPPTVPALSPDPSLPALSPDPSLPALSPDPALPSLGHRATRPPFKSTARRNTIPLYSPHYPIFPSRITARAVRFRSPGAVRGGGAGAAGGGAVSPGRAAAQSGGAIAHPGAYAASPRLFGCVMIPLSRNTCVGSGRAGRGAGREARFLRATPVRPRGPSVIAESGERPPHTGASGVRASRRTTTSTDAT